MPQIKLKVKSDPFDKTQDHPERSRTDEKLKVGEGFTLIEIIVVMSILCILTTVIVGFLLSSLSGTNKAEILKEVRQNGSYALSVMEGMILNSRSVSCPNNSTINVTDINGDNIVFLCSPDPTNGYISSNSANLTGTNITVLSCVFSCTQQVGEPARVDITFMVSQKSAANLRPSEKASLEFKSVVVTRNF